ncbi:hypothetical protein [Phycicoccus avicenniae]|uniref:hypothetical protein n=1 Tax=Phycicoccus avicenniae TaxID=2828860 RepID=UPI003D2C9852
MTTTLEEDFEGFVAARWPDLEAVALVATLDPPRARSLTTAALASLRPGWATTLESGAPTASARRAVLEQVVAPRRPDATAGSPAGLRPLVGDPESSVPAALLDALAGRTPAARALLAAGALWEVTDDELLALAPGPVIDLDAERAALLEAHRAARATDGLGPADHLLAEDLVEVVHRLASAQPDPPDPAGLVLERARSVRRRSLVLGGGAAVLAAGASGWVVLRDRGRAPTAGSSTADPTTAGPDDPAWASTASWSARGPLAADLDVQALVARSGRGARLLWAADLADVRVVVATNADDQYPDGTSVRAWTGRPGTPPARLAEVPLGFDALLGTEDLVAVGVARPGGSALVVLTRPTVGSVDFSPVVHPTTAGSVERTWTRVGLADGVGTLLLPAAWGQAARVRAERWGGPPVGPATWGTSGRLTVGDDPLDALLDAVASSTGVARADLRGDVLTDSPTDGSVLDPTAVSAQGGDGRAVLTRVRTPDGAVVRGLDVRDDGRAGGSFLSTSPLVVPAEAASAPLVLPLDGGGDGPGRYLAVVPSGGASARLVAAGGDRGPASTEVAMKRRTAVLTVAGARGVAGGLRLVVRDARGRVTYDDVPPAGRDLAGDEEEGTGWLGLPQPYE